MKKRMFCVFLMLALCLSLISACGAGTPEIIPEFDLDTGEADYNGKEFILRDVVHHGDTPLIPVYSENALDDRLLEHYENTETALNCKITRLVGDTGTCTTYMAIGERYADVMNDTYASIYNHFKGDRCIDYNEITGMELHSGKFGTDGLLKSLTWGSGTYGVVAEYWGIPTPYIADAMLFNPRILNEKLQTSPYELYENGEWTWANFENIAIAVTDTTSSPDKPVYAGGLNSYFTRAAFYSNGATIAREDDNGRLVFNLPSVEAAQAADWLIKLQNELKVFDPGAGGWEYYCDMFIAGQYAFLAEYSWVGLSKDNGRVGLNMEEEFSWVCFPRGPKSSASLATYASANFALFIPVTGETDDIGFVLTELLEPLYDEPYGWRDDFRREVFWDDQSFNNYMEMLNSAVSDYTLITSSADPLTAFSSVISGKNSAQSVFSAIAEKGQAALDDNYNKYLK